MKITWNKNPLYTTVELDEHEQAAFKATIRQKELEELIYGAYWTLTHHDWWNKTIAKDGKDKPVRTLQDTINEATKELHPDYWLAEDGETSKLDARVNELFEHYIEELKSYHVGDCTCVPCSCSKCHAEDMLGINTMKGLGKHSAHKINSAFGRDNARTIDEAITELENFDPVFTGAGGWKDKASFDYHLPRWKAEAAAALTWLKNYKEEHFSAVLPGGISRQIAAHDASATTGDAGSIPSSN